MKRPPQKNAPSAPNKEPYTEMNQQQQLEAGASLTDNVLSLLTSAFFEVVKKERWGKRDLANISGINETAIGHILSGRRKNLELSTIARLARAMRKRPELVLHDTRPAGNKMPVAVAHPNSAAVPTSGPAPANSVSQTPTRVELVP